MGRKTKYNDSIHKSIVDAIGRGAFDYIAAEMAGIDARTFYRWMASGEKYANSPYCRFCQDVTMARSHARAIAESAVWKDNPLAWLRYGPGRAKEGRDGWTDRHEVEIAGAVEMVVKYEKYSGDDEDTPSDPV